MSCRGDTGIFFFATNSGVLKEGEADTAGVVVKDASKRLEVALGLYVSGISLHDYRQCLVEGKWTELVLLEDKALERLGKHVCGELALLKEAILSRPGCWKAKIGSAEVWTSGLAGDLALKTSRLLRGEFGSWVGLAISSCDSGRSLLREIEPADVPVISRVVGHPMCNDSHDEHGRRPGCSSELYIRTFSIPSGLGDFVSRKLGHAALATQKGTVRFTAAANYPLSFLYVLYLKSDPLDLKPIHKWMNTTLSLEEFTSRLEEALLRSGLQRSEGTTDFSIQHDARFVVLSGSMEMTQIACEELPSVVHHLTGMDVKPLVSYYWDFQPLSPFPVDAKMSELEMMLEKVGISATEEKRIYCVERAGMYHLPESMFDMFCLDFLEELCYQAPESRDGLLDYLSGKISDSALSRVRNISEFALEHWSIPECLFSTLSSMAFVSFPVNVETLEMYVLKPVNLSNEGRPVLANACRHDQHNLLGAGESDLENFRHYVTEIAGKDLEDRIFFHGTGRQCAASVVSRPRTSGNLARKRTPDLGPGLYTTEDPYVAATLALNKYNEYPVLVGFVIPCNEMSQLRELSFQTEEEWKDCVLSLSFSEDCGVDHEDGDCYDCYDSISGPFVSNPREILGAFDCTKRVQQAKMICRMGLPGFADDTSQTCFRKKFASKVLCRVKKFVIFLY